IGREMAADTGARMETAGSAILTRPTTSRAKQEEAALQGDQVGKAGAIAGHLRPESPARAQSPSTTRADSNSPDPSSHSPSPVRFHEGKRPEGQEKETHLSVSSTLISSSWFIS